MISPANERMIHALYGTVLLRRSDMPAKISEPTNSRPLMSCTISAELVDCAAEAEHIVDGLLQLGQDGIAKQLVQGEQQ